MENAVDAIYIAGAVVLLLIALTIGISSFSTQIAQIDEIVEADERVDIVTEETGEFVNYISHSDSERIVSVDTIVNTLYRSYKENYTVYIKLKNSSFTSIKNRDKYSENIIKAKKTTTVTKSDGSSENIININDDLLVFKITTEYNLQNAKEKLNHMFSDISPENPNGANLYNVLKGDPSHKKRYKEYIGELYQDDITTNPGESMTEDQKKVSDYNKTKVRIITYVEI